MSELTTGTIIEEESFRSDHAFERFHIVAAMDYLARDTSIENITVSAICKQAQTSRTSFYRLFADKYDAANWFMFCALNIGNRLTGVNYNWYEGNVVTLSVCMLMRNVMISAWSSPGYHAMKETGIRKRKQDIINSVVKYKHMELTDELMFQIDCFAYLESYMVRTWIREKTPRSVEEHAAYIANTVPPKLFAALNTPLDPKPAEPLTISSMIMQVANGVSL